MRCRAAPRRARSKIKRTKILSKRITNPLFRWQFKSPEAQHVALVTLTEASEKAAMSSRCEQRRFLAALVAALSRYGAKVITIDKYYSVDACAEDGPGGANEIFRTALNQVAVPVVVGILTKGSEESGLVQGDCEQTEASFNFAMPADGLSPALVRHRVQAGMLRLNSNLLKIPLSWWVSDHGKDVQLKTLSLVSAEQADSSLESRPEIAGLLRTNEHPFGSFSETLPTWSAMDVLCGADKEGASRWSNCQGVSYTPPKFAGKVVVIGEEGPEIDVKEFPGGKMRYGAEVQADYIEALLQGHYVRSLASRWDFAMTVIFVIGTIVADALLAKKRTSEGGAFAFSLCLYLALLGLSLYLFRVHFLFTPIFFLASTGMVFLLLTQMTLLVVHLIYERSPKEYTHEA